MNVKFLLRQVSLDKKTTAIIEKKIAKLDKFFPDEDEALVTVTKIKDKEKLELTISQHGRLFRSEVTAETAAYAIDQAVDAIIRQIRKNKTRLEKHLREGAFAKQAAAEPFDDIEEEEIKVIRRKDFKLQPMTVDEAILQMNLLGHTFFVFDDSDTGNVSVVYKRNDEEYGLISTNR